MKSYIHKLHNRENLTRDEIEDVMRLIMSGKAVKEDITAFLLALRAKGPTVDEITGAARILREYVIPIKTKHTTILDTCGTGGDKKILLISPRSPRSLWPGPGWSWPSTATAPFPAAVAAPISWRPGVNINVEEQHLSACLDELGITFLFAQQLHPAMKNVAVIRKELGVETIFNILGPLTNPAKATHQILGVYNRDLVEPMANVLKNLGLKRALVVHGSDGLDEITSTAQTFIGEYDGKEVFTYDIMPDEFGLPPAQPHDLEGGDLAANVRIFEDILAGKRGPKRDVVVINAAYAFYVAERVKNINEGITLAQDSIDSGKAAKKLDALKEFTNRG